MRLYCKLETQFKVIALIVVDMNNIHKSIFPSLHMWISQKQANKIDIWMLMALWVSRVTSDSY